MVEIIERGGVQPEKTFEVTCDRCKSRLRFRQSEAIDIPPRHFREYHLLEIRCPVCHHSVTTSEAFVTFHPPRSNRAGQEKNT